MLLILVHEVDLALQALVLKPFAFQIQFDFFLSSRFANVTFVDASPHQDARSGQVELPFERNLFDAVLADHAAALVQQTRLHQILVDGLKSFGPNVHWNWFDVSDCERSRVESGYIEVTGSSDLLIQICAVSREGLHFDSFWIRGQHRAGNDRDIATRKRRIVGYLGVRRRIHHSASDSFQAELHDLGLVDAIEKESDRMALVGMRDLARARLEMIFRLTLTVAAGLNFSNRHRAGRATAHFRTMV